MTNAEKQAAWRARNKERLKLARQAFQEELRGNRQAGAPLSDPGMSATTQQLMRARERALQGEVAELRAQLRAQKTASAPQPEELLVLSAARKLVEEVRARRNLDKEGRQRAAAALAEINRVRERFVTGLHRIAAKIEQLGASAPLTALRRKMQAVIDDREGGAAEGERANAAAAIKRLPASNRFAPKPEPLPETREDLLARKR